MRNVRNLWAAVLRRAVEDVLGKCKDDEIQRNKAEAIIWFRTGSKDIGGFSWICELLGLRESAILKKTRIELAGRL